MEKRKKIVIQAVICVGLLCVIWGIYFHVMRVNNQKVKEIRKDDFSWIAQLDSVETEEDMVHIKGFAFGLNRDAKEKAFSIVLRNLDTDEMLFPKMKYTIREDVNEYFLCNYDYTNSGFEFRMKASELDLQNCNYEILVKPQWKRYAYSVGIYLFEGEPVSVLPNEESVAIESDSYLKEFIGKGQLRNYNAELGVYVYQCNNRLYWVIDREYPYFGSNGNMWMQFNLYTTQNEKLPKEQLEKKCMWNNCGFSLQEKKVTETEKYLVAESEIPQTHSITRIVTGHIGEVESWSVTLRPLYDFSRNVK